ncbi:MAG: TIGR00289 family protein [archaeon]|nr:TIGR00289 family protein [archaeon]
MRVAVLFSGGKDSTSALYWAVKQGFEIKTLITVLSDRNDSYMYHIPNAELTKFQAEAMNFSLIFIHSTGIKEKELIELKEILADLKKQKLIDGIVTGALASVYQASRIQKICDDLKLKCFNPLWQKNQEQYLKDLLKQKFEVMIVGVAAAGLDEKWLGRMIDKKAIQELIELEKKFKINVAAEGGEFETFVLNCPIFKKKLKVVKAQTLWHGNRGEYLIKEIKLVKK